MAGGERNGGRRRTRRRAEDDTATTAVVELLARGLGLERAVVLVEESPGGALVPAATWGRVRLIRMAPGEPPPDGPWSAALPVLAGGRSIGLALLAVPGGHPLASAERSLARRLLPAVGALIDRPSAEHEVRQAHDLLAHTDRLAVLGTLAAGIAHEVRNPLVSVRTFIELLPERLHDEEFRTEFRQLTLDEIERICVLLNDLLAFVRPSPALLARGDLNALVRGTVRLLEPEARKRAVSLSVVCADDLLPVLIDEGRMKQVLTNVLLNGIEASPAHGAVEVVTRLEPGTSSSIVEVADTGGGIPPALASRVFEPFVTTKDLGSGLGLYIAHRIVTEHGGSIRSRRRPRGGTVFSISLPCVSATRDAGTG